MPFELNDLLPIKVPQPGSTIFSCGGDLLAIGTKADTVDLPLMPFELADLPPVQKPQPGSTIFSCGSKLHSIRSEADTVNPTLMPFELILFPHTIQDRFQS